MNISAVKASVPTSRVSMFNLTIEDHIDKDNAMVKVELRTSHRAKYQILSGAPSYVSPHKSK